MPASGFQAPLAGHEVHTADWAGLKGLKNGRLLQQAESNGYDVLLTVDQGVPHQQNFSQRRISVLVVRTRTNQMEDLLPAVGAILLALLNIQPGQVAFAY